MAYADLPLDALYAYRPDLTVPADLDDFWATMLAETRRYDLAATFDPIDSGLSAVETFDVTFAGFGGSPIRAWLHLPVGQVERLPAIVEYVGHGGGGDWRTNGSCGRLQVRAPHHGQPRPGFRVVCR